MTPAQFIEKWKDNTLSERAGAQQHFLDLCELLGITKPDDPDNYCFERGAKRTGAGRGWSDVWKRGCFAWEYKAPKARLDTALKQLMTYALALDNPPLLVVSDRLRIEIHTHFTGTPSEIHTIALEHIGTPENLQKLRSLFSDPDQFKPKRTRTAITKQAAELFGDLALSLQQRGHEPHKVAHFLNKILFCLFAEDSAGPASDPLLPDRLFSKILDNGRKDRARFEKQLKNLFRAMADRHGEFGEHLIQWFNGGLFDDDSIIALKADDILKLENVALLDWSAIDPSIFGTLFERGLDPAKRAQLGTHYTDPVLIMRIVNPVIAEPLLAEWASIKDKIAPLMLTVETLQNSRKSADKAKATTALKAANKLYIGFLERLKHFKVLDPACGSGNFLYLALQSLKDIELRVMLEAEALDLERGFPGVGPQCVAGIEINTYAAELARVTVWIGDIQWMLKHGFAPSKEPILKTLEQIECRDALISSLRPSRGDDVGEQFVEATWPEADAIIGNPPFLGDKKMIRELGENYVSTLRGQYAGRVPGGADLVTYWFEKARAQIDAGHADRAGLVATNSIRGGANRKVIERILDTTSIFNAWGDEPWVNEGAAVRVSLICFGSAPSVVPSLDGAPTDSINSDITGARNRASNFDISKVAKLSANANVSFQGAVLVGDFEISSEVARKWAHAPNPHGVSNTEVLRPLRNGKDLMSRIRERWVIDFFGMDEKDAARFELPYLHVVEHVKPLRVQNIRAARAKYWWRHGESGGGWRKAVNDCSRFIATSQVAKHRCFVWLDRCIQPHQTVISFARDDDVTFGILQSRMHVCWAIRLGTSLEDRPRYTPTTCFETYPLPKGLTPDLKPEQYLNAEANEVAEAAKHLNELRENWLNPAEWADRVAEIIPGYPDRTIPKPEYAKAIKERTLTNLYNKRAKGEVQWLEDVHRALDAAVARAYGWNDYTPEMPDEEILRRLLELNLKRAAEGR